MILSAWKLREFLVDRQESFSFHVKNPSPRLQGFLQSSVDLLLKATKHKWREVKDKVLEILLFTILLFVVILRENNAHLSSKAVNIA